MYNNTNNPIEAARNHLAAYPNAFFVLQKDVKMPYGNTNTTVLCAEINGNMHPLSLPGIQQHEYNAIDNLTTDHNTALFARGVQSGGQVAEVKEVPAQAASKPLPIIDVYANDDDDEDDDDTVFDEDDNNEDAEHDDDAVYAGYQRDLRDHEVPGMLAEQARRTQAINDETIVGKMTEYHQVQTGHYTWNDAMKNLLVEAAMIASQADRNALVGADGRSRIIPGMNGPTSAMIVDTDGSRHDLMFVDHRLRVTDATALSDEGRALLVRANDMLLANIKRQVLEVAEALRFIEPKKKNFLATLGDIVAGDKIKREEERGHQMTANRKRVTARVSGREVYGGTTTLNLEGEIEDRTFTAQVSISAERYSVHVYDVYGDAEENVIEALQGAEAHYRAVAGKVIEANRENLIERVTEYVPSAKELARRLGDEIRGMEQALALA